MKKLINILSIAAVASLTVLSCQKEQEVNPRTPSPAEVAGCYGVYFPTQEASGDHVYNPTQDPEIEITVARTNDSGAITVPIKATYSEDGIFVPQDIQFADGQKETTIKVRFDKAKEGVNYKASFTIEDGQYASLYNSNPISIDFSIMRVEMLYFLNPKTNEKAVFTFTQDWWGETAYCYIKYYEVDGIRTCFTETFGHLYNGQAYDTPGFFGTGADYEWTFYWYVKSNYIRMAVNNTGYHHSSYDADIYALDYYYYETGDETGADFLDYADENSDVVSYYDGNGGFYLSMRSYYMFGIGGWNPGEYDVVGVAEGFTRVDYSFEAETGLTEDGEVPVLFTAGADVVSAKLAAYEGTLTPTQVANKVAEIVESQTATVFSDFEWDEDDEVNYGSTSIAMEETGVYTLVAVALDKDGNAQNSASAEFTYVSAENPVPVVISCGLEKTGKYTKEGFTTENSLEVYIYGEDIVDVKAAVFKYVDIASKGVEEILEELMDAESLPADAIEKINGTGYVDVIGGLIPGTEFYLVVWASNGYEQTVILSEGATTDGDPLPIYQDYDVSDYYADGALPNREAIVGTTWNYYALDWYGSLGLREYLGKVKITASPTETEGPDKYGLYDEYVLLDGLFPNALVDGPYYGYDVGDCIVEFDVYDGIIYSCSKTTFDGKSDIHHYSAGLGGWYNATYYSAFVPVADGYYAFMDVSGEGYDFCGIRIVNEYVWDAFLNLLLIDPAKDDNGVAPAAVQAKVAAAQKKMNDIASASKNFVETEKGRIHSIIEKYNNTANNFFAPAGLEGLEFTHREAKINLTSRPYVKVERKAEKGFLAPLEK